MTKYYIIPEAFEEAMKAKNLSSEQIFEKLKLKQSIFESIFSGVKRIDEYSILVLTEIFEFDFHKVIKKSQDPHYIFHKKQEQIQKNEEESISTPSQPDIIKEYKLKEPEKHYPGKHKCTCCNYLIFEALNYCPNCGNQLPEEVRFCDSDQSFETSTDQHRLIYPNVLKTRLRKLGLLFHDLSESLPLTRPAFQAIMKGQMTVRPDIQELISKKLEAPVHYWSGEAEEVIIEKVE
ncbi:hypothetical protein DF185_06425 [Marinifilum breve]|uniref:Zinc-ribbon domain-containing protein n=1 Tax=Marinifilum breve TaxID=2184082 RepID=A0A2V4A0M9_9BACT|nr:zinc ribbon domain-containing protein [Marinifilum breve]PXY02279.1 hypothetical protein DF185_06425 [Marinifilum breve]